MRVDVHDARFGDGHLTRQKRRNQIVTQYDSRCEVEMNSAGDEELGHRLVLRYKNQPPPRTTGRIAGIVPSYAAVSFSDFVSDKDVTSIH